MFRDCCLSSGIPQAFADFCNAKLIFNWHSQKTIPPCLLLQIWFCAHHEWPWAWMLRVCVCVCVCVCEWGSRRCFTQKVHAGTTVDLLFGAWLFACSSPGRKLHPLPHRHVRKRPDQACCSAWGSIQQMIQGVSRCYDMNRTIPSLAKSKLTVQVTWYWSPVTGTTWYSLHPPDISWQALERCGIRQCPRCHMMIQKQALVEREGSMNPIGLLHPDIADMPL